MYMQARLQTNLFFAEYFIRYLTGVVDTVNMTVEGTPNLRLIIQKLKRSNGELNSAIATRTVCPGFDGNLLLIALKDVR